MCDATGEMLLRVCMCLLNNNNSIQYQIEFSTPFSDILPALVFDTNSVNKNTAYFSQIFNNNLISYTLFFHRKKVVYLWLWILFVEPVCNELCDDLIQ